MKRLLLILLIVAASFHLHAQVAINTTASLPNASSMLDISSTTKGLLIPRMSSVQRTAIATPADGLTVYDNTTESIWYYKAGTGWLQIASNPVTLTLPYTGTANSTSTLFSITNTGTGMAINASSAGGTGTYTATASLSSAGIISDNTGAGEAITGRTVSQSGTPTGSVVGRNDGPGYGTQGFIATDASGNGIGVLGEVGISGSTGKAGHFENLNASNTQTALEAVTNGTGSAFTATNTNASTTVNILNVTSVGPGVIADHSQGNAGNFFMNNTNSVGAGVRGETNSIFGNFGTAGVYGTASGTGGYGGYFDHTNATGFGNALFATTAGLGADASFQITNTSNAQPTIVAATSGTGSVGSFTNTNSSNTSNALYVTSNGPGVIPDHSQGNAGSFFMNNTSGVGAGVRGEVNSIFGNKGTAGVYGVSSGTGGYGGYFEHTSTTGYGIVVQAVNYGQGTVLVADQEGTSGDPAIFQTAGVNKARIDRTGKGFFDGGTQSSGADLAEAFDVEGNKNIYSAGDVLIISTKTDRTLEKSDTAYSMLVAGVYATKPGVLLTEKDIEQSLDKEVPLGVVGVIPTKVCNQNGAIKRGDILVTSDKAGYAMKADLNKLKPGEAIGKSLENFDAATGVIKVLVNVK